MGWQNYLVKPFPSTLITIQQCGSKLSSASKFFTYSKRLFAMHACRTMLAGPLPANPKLCRKCPDRDVHEIATLYYRS